MLDQGSLQVFGVVSAGVCTAAEARRDACATLERLWGEEKEYYHRGIDHLGGVVRGSLRFC